MALQKCGYSTSPTYGVGLCTLMRDYNLTQYDLLPPATAASLSSDPVTQVADANKEQAA